MHKLLVQAKKHFQEAEVFSSTSKTTSIAIFEGELDNYEMAESGGMGLRGYKDGKMGYSYTENLDEEGYQELIEASLESLALAEEEEDLYDGSGEYEDIQPRELIPTSPDKVIESLKKLEKLVLANDQIEKVPGAAYSEMIRSSSIENTLGLNKSQEAGVALIYIMAAAEKDGQMKTGMAVRVFWDFDEVNLEEMAQECIEDTLSKLGAKSIASGDYRVLIDKEAFDNLNGSFMSAFSGEVVEKKMSLLDGKLDEEVAASNFSLKMAPLGEDNPLPSTFDGEGYPRRNLYLVEDGVLKNFYHNRATAKRAGTQSTGSASRSYKSRLGLGPSYLVIEPGERSQEEIIASMDKGVYIKGFQGLHSGLNAVSGDFSLPAEGFYVEEGQIVHPVDQVVLSGNYFKLIKDILELSSDSSRMNTGSTSPGVLVDSLSLAGI